MSKKTKAIFSLIILGAFVLAGLYIVPQKNKNSLAHQPLTASSLELLEQIKTTCSDYKIDCVKEELKEATKTYGPSPALETLTELVDKRLLVVADDFHQVAHEIGRETAKDFGINGESFLLCPTSYNYGCQHGFFEHVLGRSDSTKAAAEHICGSFASNPAYSSKFEFYCYHGVGHGVLMAQAYDLTAALADCDSFSSPTGRQGCWQGVFMENVNGGLKGEAREGVFSKTNPLSPCDRLDSKYGHQCYINHAGWLMHFFNGKLQPSIQACLKASSNNISSCLQSLGLMVTNPGWQASLSSDSGDSEKRAWLLCKEFPTDYIEDCISGAVDNIQNFENLEVTRAARFCNYVDLPYQTLCYKRIGSGLRSQATSTQLILEQCRLLDDQGQDSCLSGANLQK